jgi:midasin
MDEEISHHIAFCLKHTPIAPQKLWNLWSLLHIEMVKIQNQEGNKPPSWLSLS